MSRAARAFIAVLMLFLLGAPTPAGADAPGPTDYRTEVVAIEPDTGTFEVEIIGGDSFVLMRQLEPSDVLVLGYRGEPYLRFRPDGTVEQNRRSPAVYLNEERYGDDEDALPPEADASAEPEWEVVAEGGSYAWHDHRAHWMLRNRPFGKEPGDQILEGVIPVFVDDREVDVTVASYWQSAPSPLPLALGAAAGLGALLASWRRRSLIAVVAVAAGLLALVIGGAQFASVPSETGPSSSLILLPALALMAGIGALVVRKRPATALPLLIGSTSALLAFGALRLPTIQRAILPTELPDAIDRGVSVAVTVVALGVLVVAALDFSRLMQGRPAGDRR